MGVNAPQPQGGDIHQRYAQLLNWGTRAGLVLLVLSFTAYLFGVLTPHVPLERLPQVWNLPVASYHEVTHTPKEFDWTAFFRHGDRINMIGIAVLAGCSLLPLLALIPMFLRRRDIFYAIICALEVMVLLLAASGVLTSGH
jgi:hypothetical protein